MSLLPTREQAVSIGRSLARIACQLIIIGGGYVLSWLRYWPYLIALVVTWVLAFDLAHAATDPALIETRYCGTPKRNAQGSITRRADVLSAFRREHPCPATGKTTGACPGWEMNHVVPLACGGCDVVSNLDWMPDSIKTCADPHCRDRFERQVYAASQPIPGTSACKNTLVP